MLEIKFGTCICCFLLYSMDYPSILGGYCLKDGCIIAKGRVSASEQVFCLINNTRPIPYL